MATKPELLQSVPLRRLKPVDGMAVTAEVWDEAHDFHRHQLRLHALLNHGAGIVTGLEVIASDPADNAVYILPGIAADSAGQMITLTQPTSFDLGRSDGLLHLLLTYGESRPRPTNGASEDGAPQYVQAEFGIEASPALPGGPHVEVARIRRQGRGAAVVNARDPASPGPNEIDLRFRREVGVAPTDVATIAVCYLDQAVAARHGRGAAHLARYLRGPLGGRQRVWVDDDVPPTADLSRYTLVYLTGQAAFQLAAEPMNRLYAYAQAGGTILFEACRHGTESGATPPADDSFQEMIASMGVTLEPLTPGHPLLSEPAPFAILPAGFEPNHPPRVRLGGGFIYSSGDYGCVWQGERRGRPALRDEIRSTMEWGANLVAYAARPRPEPKRS
jgi:hypothetical protein